MVFIDSNEAALLNRETILDKVCSITSRFNDCIGRILWANIFQSRCHRSPSNFNLYKSIDFDTLSMNFNVVTRTNLQFLSILPPKFIIFHGFETRWPPFLSWVLCVIYDERY